MKMCEDFAVMPDSKRAILDAAISTIARKGGRGLRVGSIRALGAPDDLAALLRTAVDGS